MPRKRLNRLVISALDEFNMLVESQKLLTIAQAEIDDRESVELLLDCYLSRTQCFLDNLKSDLEQIRLLIGSSKNISD